MGFEWSRICSILLDCSDYETVGREEEEREHGEDDDDEWMKKELLSSFTQTRKLYECIFKDPRFVDTVQNEPLQDVYTYAMRKVEKNMASLEELRKQEKLVRATLNIHHRLGTCSSSQVCKRLQDTDHLLEERLQQITTMITNLYTRLNSEVTSAEYMKEELLRRGCSVSSIPEDGSSPIMKEEKESEEEEEEKQQQQQQETEILSSSS